MYRFIKDGVSVLTVVDKRRKKNNGLYPVKIEVISHFRLLMPGWAGLSFREEAIQTRIKSLYEETCINPLYNPFSKTFICHCPYEGRNRYSVYI